MIPLRIFYKQNMPIVAKTKNKIDKKALKDEIMSVL